jgi:hypothetical protein
LKSSGSRGVRCLFPALFQKLIEITESLLNNCKQDLDFQILIIVDRDVPKSDHGAHLLCSIFREDAAD